MLTVMILILLITGACASKVPDFSNDEWIAKTKSYEISKLYDNHTMPDGTFFNPWLAREDRKGPNFWFMKRMEFPDYPVEKYAHIDNSYDYLSDPEHNSISFAGHGSFIIKMDGQTVLTDPFFSDRAFIISKEVKLKFDYDKLSDRPVVLMSHNHYDHLDEETVEELIKKNAAFIVPLKLKEFFTDLGAAEVYELDWWQTLELDGITYTLLPAQHWSRRLWQSSGTTLWGGFMIEGSKTIYFSGDTGYFRGFEEFGRKYDIDYALMGVGANAPRWFMHYSHMDVPDFFLAVDEINAKVSIPMHFGIIALGHDPILYPLYEVDQVLAAQPQYKDRVKPLRVGEYIIMK